MVRGTYFEAFPIAFQYVLHRPCFYALLPNVHE